MKIRAISREGLDLERDDFIVAAPRVLMCLFGGERPARAFALCATDRRGRPVYVEYEPEDIVRAREA